MPPKTTKGSVSKRKASTAQGSPAKGPQMSASSRLQGEAQMKRTQAVRGRPKKFSAQETRRLEAEWNTVTINSLRQAKTLLDNANELHPALIRKLVKNLWCHTAIIADSRGDPTLTRADALGDPAKEIVTKLASGGMVENLAIDVTLLSDGWLFHNPARPSHVMVLSDEYLCRAYTLSWRTRLFEETTHVAFQPLLHELFPRMPAHGLRELFPNMRFCCIQVDAMGDTKQAVAFVEDFSVTLDRLVVFVRPGLGQYCTSDAPMWVAMRALAKQHPKLAVFPHQISFRAEWEKLVGGEETIWEAEVDEELCQTLKPATSYEVDWRVAFSGSARWHGEDDTPSDEDPLLFQRRQSYEEGKDEGTIQEDVVIDPTNWGIQGSLTIEQEFDALFPFSSRMAQADPYLDM